MAFVFAALSCSPLCLRRGLQSLPLRWPLILFLAGCLAPSGWAQTPASQQSAPPAKTAEEPRYDKILKVVDTADYVSELRQLVLNRYPALQGNAIGLELIRNIASPGGQHLQFAQTLQGYRIVGTTVKVNMDRGGRVYSALTRLAEPTSTTPVNDFSLTRPTLQNQVLAKTGGRIIQADTMIYLQQDRPYWAMRFRTIGDTLTGATELLVNPANGSILRQIDRTTVTHKHPPEAQRPHPPAARQQPRAPESSPCPTPAPGTNTTTGTSANGQGYVYRPDPLTSAQQQYGGAYRDLNDSATTELNSERIQVTLRGILKTPVIGNYRLEGPYVECKDIEGPSAQPPVSGSGNFFFNRDEDGFEYVNVYYHIDTMQRYIQALGFNNLWNQPLRVDAHGTTQDNSSFKAGGTSSYLSFGDGCVDDGEDADVIIHEYGHALSYAAAPNTNNGTERQGLDEGIGDYLATTYSRRISTFRWPDVFTWDGHSNECWPGRNVENSLTYGEADKGNIYSLGRLWASAMMDIWEQAGREVTDKLQLQEMYMNTQNMSLQDGVNMLLDADSMLYNGAHSNTILSVMCGRGIYDNAQKCTLDRNEAGHGPQPRGPRLSLHPNPAGERLHYRLAKGRVTALTMLDAQGRVVREQPAASRTGTIDTRGLAEGLYLLRAHLAGGQVVYKRFLKK